MDKLLYGGGEGRLGRGEGAMDSKCRIATVEHCAISQIGLQVDPGCSRAD